MKTETVVWLGAGVLAFLYLQQRNVFTVSFSAGTNGAAGLTGAGVSNGVEVPANGFPLVNAAGQVVGGGNAQTTQRPIAPTLWASGGSPSGYNASGYQGYVGASPGGWEFEF